MRDLELPFASPLDERPEIIPGKKLLAKVVGLYAAPSDHFETRARNQLELTFDGIAGDFHNGPTRRSGGREPWYPRGTEMRNERQISIIAPDEMRIVADKMGLDEIRPEWIGANLLVEGVPMLSMLPSGTKLFFKGGVTLKVDGQNAPCSVAGRAIAENAGMSNHADGALLFPKSAQRLRGLVAWVEKPGRVTVGEDISVRIPEQWIYRP